MSNNLIFQNGSDISFHINKKLQIIYVGITDSVGRTTNSIDIPFHDANRLFNNLLDKMYELGLQEVAKYYCERDRKSEL